MRMQVQQLRLRCSLQAPIVSAQRHPAASSLPQARSLDGPRRTSLCLSMSPMMATPTPMPGWIRRHLPLSGQQRRMTGVAQQVNKWLSSSRNSGVASLQCHDRSRRDISVARGRPVAPTAEAAARAASAARRRALRRTPQTADSAAMAARQRPLVPPTPPLVPRPERSREAQAHGAWVRCVRGLE